MKDGVVLIILCFLFCRIIKSCIFAARSVTDSSILAQITKKLYGNRYSPDNIFVKNWCLKRSRLLYAIANRFLSGEVRINIAMRCRDNAQLDWGHAWLSHNGNPLWEHRNSMLNKSKTMLADTGKFIYWIYN